MTADARRAAAGRVAHQVAERLTDPKTVAGLTVRLTGDGVAEHSIWRQRSLSAGHAGIAVLFAELAAEDPRWVAPLHASLQAATDNATADESARATGAFSGTGSLAVAVHAGRVATGGYQRVHDGLVTAQRRQVERLARVPVDGPIVFPDYDLVGGLAGNLVLALRLGDTTAADIAAHWLTGLALRDGDRPGWWVSHGPDPHRDPPPGGHGNLGMAHGAAGILAALCGHPDAASDTATGAAVDRLTDWLTTHRLTDRHGSYWPLYLMAGGPPPGGRRPESWCYGTVGIAWALRRAGAVRGRPEVIRTAERAVDAAVAAVAEDAAPVDTGVCHGWAGWAHALWRWDAERHAAAIDHAVDRILAEHDPSSAFGFRCHTPDGPLDHPGLLEGAAGTALVLHRYGRGGPPATGWDHLLLP